jgi:hypothetical protein
VSKDYRIQRYDEQISMSSDIFTILQDMSSEEEAMKQYQFLTRWRIEASIEEVWDVIYDVENWPQWWQYVKSVRQLQTGDSYGVGAIRRHHWYTALPYSLVFDLKTTVVQKPTRLEGEASGQLEGSGIWSLSWSAPFTDVMYDWRVRTTKNWMNWLAPIAAPVFRWNHDRVMRAGGIGLANRLGTKLIEL